MTSMLEKGLRFAFIPEVKLPESKLLRNPRLGFFKRCLELSVIILVTYIILVGRNYYKVENPLGTVTNWIEWDTDAYDAQVVRDLSKDFCTNPTAFDYVYSPNWRYDNFSCLEVSKSDRFRKEGNDLMYVPLSFNEQQERVRLLPAGANASDSNACAGLTEACATGWRKKAQRGVPGVPFVCECAEEAFYLIVGQSSFTVNLEHYYELTSQISEGSRQSSGSSCTEGRWFCEDTDSSDELMTIVVLQKDGKKESEIFGEPFVSPSPISISIGDLASAAGVGLDGFNSDTVHNYLHCDDPRSNKTTCRQDAQHYPLVRMTGMEVQLTLQYYNLHFHPRYEVLKNHRGPVCVITARVLPMWSSRPTNDCARPKKVKDVENNCTGRYYYGVSISLATRGFFGYLDFLQLLVTIGASLSYFTLPGVIMYFVTVYCLGPSSAFYRHGVHHKFEMGNALCKIVCNALTSMSAFRTLTIPDGALTEDVLRNEVAEGFKAVPGFDPQDQRQLCELVYDRLGKADATAGAAGEVGPIELPEFVENSVDGVDIGLGPALRKLLNPTRRRWPLEYVFVPRTDPRARRRATLRQSSTTSRSFSGKSDRIHPVGPSESDEQPRPPDCTPSTS